MRRSDVVLSYYKSFFIIKNNAIKMKNFKFSLSIVFVLILTTSIAQQKTALNSNGVTTIYSGPTQFVDSYNAAIDGDTIYLPGGIFNSYPTINKRLVIYGAGFHPDSISVTQKTLINNSLTIQEDADSSVIQGLEVNGTINTYNNHKVDGLVITRCLVDAISIVGSMTSPCNNVIIKENIILGDVHLANASYSDVTNNLIEGRFYNGENNAIQNNIFFYDNAGGYTLNNMNNCYIANNVFLRTDLSRTYTNIEFTTFSNNVFAGTPNPGTNTWVNNYENIDISTFFVNQTGNAPDFYQDYHLTDPATYVGYDATEVGIFGGLYPFKEGTLPNNPHFQAKTIATQTDVNGDLNIQIQVSAQDE
jgi:hypothetical protein